MKIIKTALTTRDPNIIAHYIKINSDKLLKIAQKEPENLAPYIQEEFSKIYDFLMDVQEDLEQLAPLSKQYKTLRNKVVINFKSAREIISDLLQTFPDNPIVKQFNQAWSGITMLDFSKVEPSLMIQSLKHLNQKLEQLTQHSHFFDDYQESAGKMLNKAPSWAPRGEGSGIDNIPVKPWGKPPVRTYPKQILKDFE